MFGIKKLLSPHLESSEGYQCICECAYHITSLPGKQLSSTDEQMLSKRCLRAWIPCISQRDLVCRISVISQIPKILAKHEANAICTIHDRLCSTQQWWILTCSFRTYSFSFMQHWFVFVVHPSYEVLQKVIGFHPDTECHIVESFFASCKVLGECSLHTGRGRLAILLTTKVTIGLLTWRPAGSQEEAQLSPSSSAIPCLEPFTNSHDYYPLTSCQCICSTAGWVSVDRSPAVLARSVIEAAQLACFCASWYKHFFPFSV